MKLMAHLSILTVSFITILILLAVALAAIIVIGSFVLWKIPALPTVAVAYFVMRVLIALATVITIAYALSAEYKQSVQEYLSS